MTTTFFGRGNARARERNVYQLCSRAEDNRRRDIIAVAQPNRTAAARGRGQHRAVNHLALIFRTIGGLLWAIAGAAPLIITESVMVEATKAAPTPAGDLRDAAVRTSEAVCCMTIPSVDTAPFLAGSRPRRTLVTQR